MPKKKESSGGSGKGGTTVRQCTCAAAFQDARYGRGLRLHNISIKDSKITRCTVCGAKKS